MIMLQQLESQESVVLYRINRNSYGVVRGYIHELGNICGGGGVGNIIYFSKNTSVSLNQIRRSMNTQSIIMTKDFIFIDDVSCYLQIWEKEARIVEILDDFFLISGGASAPARGVGGVNTCQPISERGLVLLYPINVRLD